MANIKAINLYNNKTDRERNKKNPNELLYFSYSYVLRPVSNVQFMMYGVWSSAFWAFDQFSFVNAFFIIFIEVKYELFSS